MLKATEPVERLRKKVLKENLWIFILSLLKNQPRYRYEVKDLIKEKFGFISGNVTAYKVLYFLELGRYVKSFDKDGKRYYAITDSGKEQLKEAERFFHMCSKMVNSGYKMGYDYAAHKHQRRSGGVS